MQFGRRIILGYWVNNQSDLSELQKDYLGLANEYKLFWFMAYTDIEAKEPVVLEQLLRKHYKAACYLKDCLHEICQTNSFKRFWIKSTLHELQQITNKRPITIINVTNI